MEEQADVPASPSAALSGQIAIGPVVQSPPSRRGRSPLVHADLTSLDDGCDGLVDAAGMAHRIRDGMASARLDLASARSGRVSGITIDFDQTIVGVADAPLAVPA